MFGFLEVTSRLGEKILIAPEKIVSFGAVTLPTQPGECTLIHLTGGATKTIHAIETPFEVFDRLEALTERKYGDSGHDVSELCPSLTYIVGVVIPIDESIK